MKKIFNVLKEKWIQYGFETIAIVVGILGAFTIENWSDTIKQHKDDIDFLRGLKNEIILDTTIISQRRIRDLDRNSRIEKTLIYFDNNSHLSKSEYDFIGSTFGQLPILGPGHQNVLRNDVIISEGVLNRIDYDLNQKFIIYLERIKWNTSVVTKLSDKLSDIVVQNLDPLVDLQYLDYQNRTVNFEFDKIKNDRLIRNAIHRSFLYRSVSINQIKNQIEEAEELISMIDIILDE